MEVQDLSVHLEFELFYVPPVFSQPLSGEHRTGKAGNTSVS